jgi:hypothetical protein
MITISKECPGWSKTEIESLEISDFLAWIDDINKLHEIQNAR